MAEWCLLMLMNAYNSYFNDTIISKWQERYFQADYIFSVYLYIHACVCMCVYVYLYIYVCIPYICVYMYVFFMCIYTICVCMFVCMYGCICKYTYIYTHTQCVFLLNKGTVQKARKAACWFLRFSHGDTGLQVKVISVTFSFILLSFIYIHSVFIYFLIY